MSIPDRSRRGAEVLTALPGFKLGTPRRNVVVAFWYVLVLATVWGGLATLL